MLRYTLLLSLLLLTLGVGASSVQAQQWIQQPNRTGFATSAPVIPDYREDPNSMSPDSWDTSQRAPEAIQTLPGGPVGSTVTLLPSMPTTTSPTLATTQQDTTVELLPALDSDSITASTNALESTSLPAFPTSTPVIRKKTPAILASANKANTTKQFAPAKFQRTAEPDQPMGPFGLIDNSQSTWTQRTSGPAAAWETPVEQTTPQVPATFHEVPPVPEVLLPSMPHHDPGQLPYQSAPDFQQYSPIFQQPAGEPIQVPMQHHQGYFDPAPGSMNVNQSGDKRYHTPLNRNPQLLDDGTKFDFQQKKREYPPFSEIIATGKFFYSADVFWIEPNFQGNTAIATQGPGFGNSTAFDFDSDFQPRIKAGFESEYGPGIELTYFNLNSNSELASFTSTGGLVGFTDVNVLGQNFPSRIIADDPGETLVAQHSIDIDSATFSFFKELKFPISRVNGNFGFQYVNIAQRLGANVNAAGGANVESLVSTTDMRAWGPRAILEYFRPIGHTPLELSTSFGGSVLFGQRDQTVLNSETGLLNRQGADEFLTLIDFSVVLQYVKNIGENRNVYGRVGFINQTWIGGGTAAFPQGDFGIRGLTFGIGYNR